MTTKRRNVRRPEETPNMTPVNCPIGTLLKEAAKARQHGTRAAKERATLLWVARVGYMGITPFKVATLTCS
jgi:hypothetical protein